MKIATWLTAAMLAVAAPAAADPTNTVIFGDSTVDSGNVFAATGGAVPSAAQGYFQGRFSNGYHFGDYLNIELAGVATTASLLGGEMIATSTWRQGSTFALTLAMEAQTC